MPINKHQPLTRADAEKLAGAVGRFYELQAQTIKTPTSDAELKGLIEYISSEMLAHASELVGCFIAIRDEYEPMLNIFARVTQRVMGINARVAAQYEAAQAQVEGESKVTPLIQPSK